MYGVLTSQRAARIVPVPRLTADDFHSWELDVPAIVAKLKDVQVVWLCSPNNPTGMPEVSDDIEAILVASGETATPPLVVVDEAYFEFNREYGGASLADWRSRFPNLLVIRTMSKAFALAGIRVGFGCGSRSVIERLERVRPPGSISTISAHIAESALRAPEYAFENVRVVSDERGWLADELARRGWSSGPSMCNFLLVRVGDTDAAERAAEGLLRAGVVPRTFGPANPLRGHLRLTVRSRSENQRLLEVVESLL
jgi:histidinol-phosphate/aromatic aminotransferase/cobyric acid decarboxylase-like protein